jgi:hypothetical protein
MVQLKASVVYEPRPDTTPEAELSALANVYRFILDCHAKKEAAHPAAPNEAKGPKDARPATQNYTG